MKDQRLGDREEGLPFLQVLNCRETESALFAPPSKSHLIGLYHHAVAFGPCEEDVETLSIRYESVIEGCGNRSLSLYHYSALGPHMHWRRRWGWRRWRWRRGRLLLVWGCLHRSMYGRHRALCSHPHKGWRIYRGGREVSPLHEGQHNYQHHNEDHVAPAGIAEGLKIEGSKAPKHLGAPTASPRRLQRRVTVVRLEPHLLRRSRRLAHLIVPRTRRGIRFACSQHRMYEARDKKAQINRLI